MKIGRAKIRSQRGARHIADDRGIRIPRGELLRRLRKILGYREHDYRSEDLHLCRRILLSGDWE